MAFVFGLLAVQPMTGSLFLDHAGAQLFDPELFSRGYWVASASYKLLLGSQSAISTVYIALTAAVQSSNKC